MATLRIDRFVAMCDVSQMTDLRAHLTAAQIKQGDFAQRIGISRTYLNEIVCGKKLPTLEIAFAIQRETGGAVEASSWLKEAS